MRSSSSRLVTSGLEIFLYWISTGRPVRRYLRLAEGYIVTVKDRCKDLLILTGRELWQIREFPKDNPVWSALISISKNIPCHLLFIIRSVSWFLYRSTIYKRQRATKNRSRNVTPFCVFFELSRRPYGATKVCNIKDGLQLSSMMKRKKYINKWTKSPFHRHHWQRGKCPEVLESWSSLEIIQHNQIYPQTCCGEREFSPAGKESYWRWLGKTYNERLRVK